MVVCQNSVRYLHMLMLEELRGKEGVMERDENKDGE